VDYVPGEEAGIWKTREKKKLMRGECRGKKFFLSSRSDHEKSIKLKENLVECLWPYERNFVENQVKSRQSAQLS